MEDNAIISIRHLDKTYPIGGRSFNALNDLNLNFTEGEFSGIIGPSGSGKTTLLNIIGSLDVPTGGEAQVLGHDIKSLSQKAAARVRNIHFGFIFQTYNLFPVYSVFENVEFPLLLLKMPTGERRAAVEKALAWVGLSEKAANRPAQLSGGESQRVAIARAIVKKPKIVLADEPTANLDAKNSHRILQTMVSLNQELGTTFIFATHDEKVIGYLRRIITLEDGRVIRDESKSPAPSPSGVAN